MRTKVSTIALLLLVLAPVALNAQYVSDNGWFEISVGEGCPVGGCVGNIVRGCAPLTITVTSTTAAPLDCFDGSGSCDFDYIGNNNQFTDPPSSTITYDQPGQFTLRIAHSNVGVDQITIQISTGTAPEFSIFSCSNERIQVNITDTQFENYIIDFGDGSPTITRPQGAGNAQHSYLDNLPKTVSVRGVDDNGANNCAIAQDIVEPVSSIPTSAFDSLVSLNSDEIALYYNLQPDVQHRLEIKAGNAPYTTFKQVNATSEGDTLQNLDVANTSYCFRIVSNDPCEGFNLFDVQSPEICNTLLDVEFLDGNNALTWTVGGNTTEFDISRLQTSDGTLLIRPGLPGFSFDDTEIDCEQEYCYTILSRYFDNSTSRSLQVCGNSFNTSPPSAINNLSASLDGNNVVLNWPETPNETIAQNRILKGSNSTNLTNLSTAETNTFLDANVNPDEGSFCYQVLPQDECGNINTTGTVACTMFLTGFIAADNTVNLFWNDYEGWSQGISNYLVEKSYLSGDAPDASSPVSEFQQIDANGAEQVINYRIQAVPNDNSLEPVFSNTITLIKPNNIYFPNAFTPDGNGNNDTFIVNGRFILSYDLRIFNRWGEEVFNSTSIDNAWDGTREGKPLPRGAYAFKVEIVDQAGQEITEAGTVLLLRN